MSFGNKGLIYVKKRTFPQIVVLYIMLLPFCFGFFIELLRVPNIIKYTIDVFWIGLFFLMIFKRSIMVKKNTVVSLLLILAFLLYSFTVYLFNYQSPFYFLWGLRNNFRFYVFFFAVISFTAIEDVDLIFKIAGIGIIVAIINQLLSKSGRDEQALMVTLSGLVIVLLMLAGKISELFNVLKRLFSL